MPAEVLFVEDDDDLREVVAESLRDAGFRVVEVERAASALPVLEGHLPDVILLDLFMPPGEMEGIELLARIRETGRWAAIPVVVYSGFGDILNRDLLARLGVSAVLLKSQARYRDVVLAVRAAVRP
jgi:CheY-like chemotaxis protein